jgi:hypothetical protein
MNGRFSWGGYIAYLFCLFLALGALFDGCDRRTPSSPPVMLER